MTDRVLILLHAANTAELVTQAQGREKVNTFFFFPVCLSGVNFYPWQHFVATRSQNEAPEKHLLELTLVSWPSPQHTQACWVNLNTNNLFTTGHSYTSLAADAGDDDDDDDGDDDDDWEGGLVTILASSQRTRGESSQRPHKSSS